MFYGVRFLIIDILLTWVHCRIFPIPVSYTGNEIDVKNLFGGKSSKICNSKACLDAAANIIESVNTSANPCDDFYSFACGRWIEKHPVPATENYWNQFEILDEALDRHIYKMLEEPIDSGDPDIVNDAKAVFRACMNDETLENRGLQPIIDLLEKLGGWPMAGWTDSRLDWTHLVAQATNLLADSPIMFAYVEADRKNTSRNIITIDQPSLVLPRFLLAESHQKTLIPYIEYVAETARMIAKANGQSLPTAAVYMEATALVKFESKLAKLTKKEEYRRDANKMYHLLTINELQELTNQIPVLHHRSQIQWLKFLKQVLGENGKDISPETPVVVTDIHFLTRLFMFIDVTPLRVIVNYIQWRVVRTMSRDLTKNMRQLNFKFKQQVSGISEDQPRWRECVVCTGYMGFAVGYMYVTRYFSHMDKEKAVAMVDNIRAAFRNELDDINWMDAETQAAALEKADYMNYFIGYPAWYHNHSALAEYYRGLHVGNHHFENKIRLRSFLVRKAFAKLNRPTDREEWLLSPAVVNAFYNSHVNSIIFPAAILQPPFFSGDQPESLNYGSIGAVMGHEVSHGFDDLGRQSDKIGNIHQWWSTETEKTYLKNAQCFIDQYDKYRVPELDLFLQKKVTMNGILTLGENIADNGGLRSAYRAYKASTEINGGDDVRLQGLEHLTPDQLFFLGFANVWCESTTFSSLAAEVLGDSHAPHKLRVIGTLSNSEEFAKAWKCPKGSPMNPENKCLLW